MDSHRLFANWTIVHFLASSALKSRYLIKPALLHVEMAATQTMAWGFVSQSSGSPRIPYMGIYLCVTHLNSQEEKVEVEVDTG